jgi:hypothetical protein
MLKHESDPDVAREIMEDERFFRHRGPEWCSYMISLAPILPRAIEIFEAQILAADRRHRQNLSTLLGAAFLALHGRAPDEAEAISWSQEYAPSVERLAEDIERDNSQECLDHLFAYVVDKYPLGHWIAVAAQDGRDDDPTFLDAKRVTRTFDIVVKQLEGAWVALIRNGSPNIERIFGNTLWEGRGWERALRALEGSFRPKDPVYFGGPGQKSRCIGIPNSYIPEPFEMFPSGDIPY